MKPLLPRVRVVCKNCPTVMELTRAAAKRARYCSRLCSDTYKRANPTHFNARYKRQTV